MCLVAAGLRDLGIPGDAGEELCFAVAQNSTLTELYLEDNKLGEDGVVAMCNFLGSDRTSSSLANNRSLVTLCLDGNGIGERAMASLGDSLASQPSLTELSLSRNPLFTTEVDLFGDKLKRNTTLKVLRLSECHVGPKFPAKTMMIKGLQVLDLSKNKLEELPHGVGAHEALRNLNLKDNTPRLQKRLQSLADAARKSAGDSSSQSSSSASDGVGNPADSSADFSWKLVHRQLKELARVDAEAMARIGGFQARRI